MKKIYLFFLITSISYSSIAQKVGINTDTPEQTLDINGKIVVSDDANSPTEGTLRYNATSQDFEGYNGSEWSSFTKSESNQGSASSGILLDIDGNIYKTVVIGTQEWMAENLRTTTYNDGTEIPHIPLEDVWKLTIEMNLDAYVWYNNDESYKFPYGALYNGRVALSGKLCPTGWRVPTAADWSALATFAGGNSVAGGKLKTAGNVEDSNGLWINYGGGTDDYGFAAIPSGQRTFGAVFNQNGSNSFFWTSTEVSSNLSSNSVILNNVGNSLLIPTVSQENGYSCRCIKE